MNQTVTPASGHLSAKLTAQDFMEVAVAFANAAPDDVRMLVRGHATLRANRITLASLRGPKIDPDTEALVDAAKELQREVCAALRALTDGTIEEKTKWRRNAQEWLQEVRIIAKASLPPKGGLALEHDYVPGSDRAVIGLLYAFLLDPKEGFGKRLRLCGICGRFFLASFGPQGGGNPQYCEEHRKAAELAAAAERQRRLRERRKSQKRKPK